VILYVANLRHVTHWAATFVKEKDAMAEILPRWEGRSFGRGFGDAESNLAKMTPSGVQDSDEIYLLSGAGENVKIRDALMDIEVKQGVNSDGLEQWTPVMKAEFPLPAIEAAKVHDALDVPISESLRSSYTLEELLAHLTAQDNGVRVVKVH
jgi:exopolyphosphatase / guanosine-5'-triphosphate,3'-diphosphate pyrophosphatase